ncbi:MAG: phosphotyrosine protein phosphatase [Planctomycetota bacterium]|nr:phosphotyrosine protein phosphatase [Planctomycetota bacterium]
MIAKLSVLFVCSMNQWRSPAAEQIYRDHPAVNPRSAGTNKGARRAVSSELIEWADLVFVMEQKHLKRLREQFSETMRSKPVAVLDIPDRYRYMDPELIGELQRSVNPILEQALQGGG